MEFSGAPCRAAPARVLPHVLAELRGDLVGARDHLLERRSACGSAGRPSCLRSLELRGGFRPAPYFGRVGPRRVIQKTAPGDSGYKGPGSDITLHLGHWLSHDGPDFTADAAALASLQGAEQVALVVAPKDAPLWQLYDAGADIRDWQRASERSSLLVTRIGSPEATAAWPRFAPRSRNGSSQLFE
jgi:hypothetical protein